MAMRGGLGMASGVAWLRCSLRRAIPPPCIPRCGSGCHSNSSQWGPSIAKPNADHAHICEVGVGGSGMQVPGCTQSTEKKRKAILAAPLTVPASRNESELRTVFRNTPICELGVGQWAPTPEVGQPKAEFLIRETLTYKDPPAPQAWCRLSHQNRMRRPRSTVFPLRA